MEGSRVGHSSVGLLFVAVALLFLDPIGLVPIAAPIDGSGALCF
jgi:hypothetical protein